MTTQEAEERAVRALLGEEEDAEAAAWAVWAGHDGKAPRVRIVTDAALCRCGCGTPTKSAFAPGHDGRVCGWILAVARGKTDKVPPAKRRDARRWAAAWDAAGRPGGMTHPKVKDLRIS